ncbi:hypothetical protein Q1695_015702 [Nippostrongylus brasiliensis]|nr:hypothetical protein Q1695_015702 [Nippostrongylus brasiliensis]
MARFSLPLRVFLPILGMLFAQYFLYVYKPSSSPENETAQNVEEFEKELVSKFKSKYGEYRILEDNICLEGGERCVSVRDYAVYNKEKGAYFSRHVFYEGMDLSDARLKPPKAKHKDYMDTSKWEIDKGYLTKECYTPVFREEMHISGAVKMDRQAKANVLVIGLGAGYFNAYLHSVFPKFNVTGVDIEPEMVRIALKWYGLVLDDRQHVYTMDGVDYLKQAASEGTKFDVIFVDACIMNLKLDVLCPVPIFLSKDVVRSMYEVLQEGGAVISNVLSFTLSTNELLRKVMTPLREEFPFCTSRSAPLSPPNMVVSCTKRKRPEGLSKAYAAFEKELH